MTRAAISLRSATDTAAQQLLRARAAELILSTQDALLGEAMLGEATLGDATLDDAHSRFFLVECHGQAVGCAALRLKEAYAEVSHLYVSALQRRKGIARALLFTLEDYAILAGQQRLRLNVPLEQTVAISLFRRCGFVDRTGDKADPLSLFMEKPLK